jgi:hypothetical protein
MNALFQALANPGSMTNQQWLLLAVMVVVVVVVLHLIRRLYRMAWNGSRKEPYVPNIGRKRLDAERDRNRK